MQILLSKTQAAEAGPGRKEERIYLNFMQPPTIWGHSILELELEVLNLKSQLRALLDIKFTFTMYPGLTGSLFYTCNG